jgi:molybdate transport system substrate-binding protein
MKIRLVLLFALSLLALTAFGCASPTPTAIPLTAAPTPSAPRELVVAAASDLTFAFREIGALFEQETGVKVIFSFGSTGQLAQQIEQGAPFDLFAAANESFVNELEANDRVLRDTKELYAQGRITLWTRADSGLKIASVQDLTQSGVKYVAIASPDHAPYGVAAREAMQSVGIWEQIQPRLVLGENALATLQYGIRGEVDVVIAPLSLSISQKEGQWVLIPSDLHKPINQALAVVKHSPHEKDARAFARFINSEKGRPIMIKYGFVLPSEKP